MLAIIPFLITSAFAVEFSRYQTSPQLNHLQRFKIESKKITFEKRTTIFDERPDLRVGVFVTHKSQLGSGVEKVLTKVKVTDRFLQQQGFSFNQLTGDPLHRRHWIVDEFRIVDNSGLAPELEKNLRELQGTDWKILDGAEISPDKKSVRFYKKGTPGPYRSIAASECADWDAGKICNFRPHGVIYVR